MGPSTIFMVIFVVAMSLGLWAVYRHWKPFKNWKIVETNKLGYDKTLKHTNTGDDESLTEEDRESEIAMLQEMWSSTKKE